MVQTIVTSIITFIITALLGYCVARIKDYKKEAQKNKEKENLQNKALMTLLKNDLTSTYFIYSELKQIPDYVYQNFIGELQVYEELNGDGFIHNIAEKMKSWDIVKTDVL